MTDEIMKRANAFAEHQAKKHFPMSHQEQDRKTVVFVARISYLQGMQDADAKKELLKECEEALNRAVAWHQSKGNTPHGIDEMSALLRKLEAARVL